MLRRYVTAVVGRPKFVIAAVVLVTLVLGFFIGRLRVLLDVDQQLPPGHPLVVVGKRIEKLFGGKYMTVVGFYSESGTIYTPATLAKVKRVTDALEKIPGVKPGSVLSLMSPRIKDVHSTDDALEITPLATKVPANDAEIAAFKERVTANSFLTSLFVSDDGRVDRGARRLRRLHQGGRPAQAGADAWRRSSGPSASRGWRSCRRARRRSCTG